MGNIFPKKQYTTLIQILETFTQRNLSRDQDALIDQLNSSIPKLKQSQQSLINIRKQRQDHRGQRQKFLKYKQSKQQYVKNLEKLLKDKGQPILPVERQFTHGFNTLPSVTDLQKQLDNQKSSNIRLSNELYQLKLRLETKSSQVNKLPIKRQNQHNRFSYGLNKSMAPKSQNIKMETLQQENNPNLHNSDKIKQLQRQIQDHNCGKQQLLKIITSLNVQLRQKEDSSNILGQQLQLRDSKIQNSNLLIMSLQQKLNQRDQNVKNISDSLKQKDKTLSNTQQKLIQIQQQRMNSQKHFTKKIKILQQQKYSFQRQIRTLKQQLENEKATSSKHIRFQSLFTGDVLEEAKQRKYLTKILQEKTGKCILKTKLIYRFDRFSKSNFHQYFDYKEQLVLLIRTKSGLIFGGWTEGGFIPKAKSEKSGLLFSLTNERYFELSQPNRKAITYDEFNIIFGNSEIVIQSLKDEVYSNFGIKNGFYNCGDYTVDLMLGAGESKEAQIQTYEMFQLSFEK